MDLGTERPAATLSPAARDQRIIDLAMSADKEALRRFAARTGATTKAIRARARKLGLTPPVIRKCRLAGTRPKRRACLRCDSKFLSRGRHNRLCRRCARKTY